MIISKKRYEKEIREAIERELHARYTQENNDRQFSDTWRRLHELERRIEQLERIAQVPFTVNVDEGNKGTIYPL